MSTPVPTKQPASLRKKLVWVAAILIGLPALWTAVFWQEITVYREFKRLCASDAGLKVFEKLEPGQVWEVAEMREFQFPSWPKQIEAFRAPDRSGQLIDARQLGIAHPADEKNYRLTPADLSTKPRYRKEGAVTALGSEISIGLTEERIVDVATAKALIRYRSYAFSPVKDPSVIFPNVFASPISGGRCPLNGYLSRALTADPGSIFKE